MSSGEDGEMKRDRWCSRGAFIITALASTVAFSSLWRFPWLTYKFGGGVFLIPYAAALLFVGIPLLTLELSLGQVFQSGNISAFGQISKRLRGLGFASLYAGFMIAGYYSVLAAYAGYYFVNSFWNPAPWTSETVDLTASKNFFFNGVLHFSSEPTGVIAANLFAGLIITWGVIYFSIYKGPNVTGRVVPTFFFLALAMLGAILGRALTLPGGFEGMMQYIGGWDFGMLYDTNIWTAGVTQALFSVGVCFGIMTAYGSYNQQSQGAVFDSITVATLNMVISCFVGLTVFTVLGYVANQSGVTLFELLDQGMSLAFLVYPVALSTLPFPQIWNALFFASLYFLILNPIFSLAEAAITALNDSKAHHDVQRYAIATAICAIGLAMSTAYCSDIGFTMIGVIDHYINNYLLLLVAFVESVSVGWIYCADQQRRQIGAFATVFMGVTYFTSIITGITCSLILQSQYSPMDPSTAWWWGAVVGGGVFLIGFIISAACAKNPMYEGDDDIKRGKMWWLLMSNPEMARSDINSVIGRRGCPILATWSVLMKWVLPLGFAVMFALNAQVTVHYQGFATDVYSFAYQMFGLTAAGFGAFLIALGVFFPSMFDGLMPPTDKMVEGAEVDGTDAEKESMIARKIDLQDRDEGVPISDAGIAVSVV